MLAACLLMVSASAAAACYVKFDATGSNDGTSWADAYTDLQSALNNNSPNCLAVFVARGTYKPTQTNNRSISFNVRPGAFVFGGFAGTEASTDERFLAANETILSGDLGLTGDNSDNSFHVVVMDGTTAGVPIVTGNTQLSDFTIRDGNASGSLVNQDKGGGLFCNGTGASHECSPELDNLVFEGNSASNGGAMYNAGGSGGKSSPHVKAAVFRNNTAGNAGAAMYNDGNLGTSSPLVEQASFIGNTADFAGGGMYSDGTSGVSSPTVRNSTFYANTGNFGGAMVSIGTGGHANPVLRYVTFTQNRTKFGGGAAIRNFGASGESFADLSGVILWGDQSASAPVEMETQGATPSSIEYSITPECPVGAVGCINADPLLGALADNDGFAPTLKPGVGSPAINAGNAVNCPANDQRGVTRPQGAQCDIGAVELRPAETQRCYVNKNNPSPGSGLSWATSYQTVYSALSNAACSEVWVAAGIYVTSNLLGEAAFGIPPGKALYGGFAGTETALGQRNVANNETILDGSLLYHVISIDATASATNVGGSTILDGFTITNGHAGGADAINQIGGGLICNANSGYICNPTLANLIFSGNTAVAGGGAIANNGSAGGMSSPRLQSVTFSANHADQRGGAIFNIATGGGISSPTIADGVFIDNTAGVGGGAIYNAGGGGLSAPTVARSVFDGNSSPAGGAILNDAASPVFTDDVFAGNQGHAGGAVYSNDTSGAIDAQYTRVTFVSNSSTAGGGAVIGLFSRAASSQVLERAIFIGNTSTNGIGGAAVQIGGSLVVRESLFARNTAPLAGPGALSVSGGVGATIDSSTFTNNSAYYSGAVSVVGQDVKITNCTFAGNAATTFGGAIGSIAGGQDGTVPASIELKNVTFSGNQAGTVGGAMSVDDDNDAGTVTATITDSIFWGNTAAAIPSVFTGSTGSTTITHSIVQDGCPLSSTCSSVTSSDPLFGRFQFYGGFTPTVMPASGSPALNVGVSCAAVDQRGVARPQGAACDLGAVERRSVEDYIFNDGFGY